MFERRKIRRFLKREHNDLVLRYEQALANEDGDLEVRLQRELDHMEVRQQLQIDQFESERVINIADRLDVELLGQTDAGCWTIGPPIGKVLNSRGRALMRERIHEEKKRRFEQKARWVQLLLPFLTAIAGVVGTITGLVAVLHRK